MARILALALSLCSIAIALPSPAAAATGPETDARMMAQEIAAVRSVGERWQALYEAGQYPQIADLYTVDTIVMPRGRPAIYGRDAMRKSIGGLAAGRSVSIAINEREIKILGDYAWFLGDFTVTYTTSDGSVPPHSEAGRSLILYKRSSDGSWLIHRDMDSPAPGLTTLIAASDDGAPMPWGDATPRAWDGSDRSQATACDRLAASGYDRTRLAEPVKRAAMDVPAVVAACEADLLQYPGDARLLFQLSRVYGYTGDAAKTRATREAAALAGNHNAIFLLGFLDWMGAKTNAERCVAHDAMLLGARRGNYSGQITYASWFLQGRFAPCATIAPKDEVIAFVEQAEPLADGFFEMRFADHLKRQLAS